MGAYVEVIRNTPFVVQLFFIVFGLPNLGLKMTAGEAALLAMIVNPAPTVRRLSAPGSVTPKGSGKPAGYWGSAGVRPLFRWRCRRRCSVFIRRW